MEKQMNRKNVDVSHQIERMRALYSQIGEPLSVDVMIDLHRHLGRVLEMQLQEKTRGSRKKSKSNIPN